MPLTFRTKHIACWLLCAGTAMGAAVHHSPTRAGPAGHLPATRQIDSAYYDGHTVAFTPIVTTSKQHSFAVGPWQFGARFGHKPLDRRPNVYLVFPGAQHQAENWAEFDHNQVLSGLPKGGVSVEWDVYWAVVLDPALDADFRSERELLMTAQSPLVPGDLFEFDDIPSHAFLRRVLKIESLEDMARFRRPDGRLPRLIILPAGFSIRGAAKAPDSH